LQVIITKIAESYNPAYGLRRKTPVSGESTKFQYRKWFFTPVLAPLLQNRRLLLIFAALGVVQLVLRIAGLMGWQCPIYSAFGVVCPGCGLTTAVSMLLKGNWLLADQTHAFAPLLLILLVSMLVASVLPAGRLRQLSGSLAGLERKTGITAIVTAGMVIYWLLRLFDFI
jgi:hypothetical protein